MSCYCILFNPHASNGKGEVKARRIASDLLNQDNVRFADITSVGNLSEYILSSDPNEKIVITGGDGTLNRLANIIDFDTFERSVYYLAAGTGNDFIRDIGKAEEKEPILINKYLKDLPVICVNGKESKFINGIGYGIDGYCCEEADKIKEKSPQKKINYTLIALKGLLGGFTPVNATVIVDGEEKNFSRVWMVPTMKGRYFGGGMMPTPDQNRFDKNKLVSVGAMHSVKPLRALTIFPGIFKGKLSKHTKYVDIRYASSVTVKFNRPTALQIDGETVLGVLEYTVKTVNNTALEDALQEEITV